MLESIKHLLGLCGESHPSIIYIWSTTPLLLVFKNQILSLKYKIINKIKSNK